MINAPLPYFTSSTIKFAPLAIFFETIEDAINGIILTVEVTSRSAYIFPSAGASVFVCEAKARFISLTCDKNLSSDKLTSKFGIASNLSMVPPVCPSPLPESFATLKSPNEATSGINIIVILSPTPPLECLSITNSPRQLKSRTSPESTIAFVRYVVSSRSIPTKYIAISKAEA